MLHIKYIFLLLILCSCKNIGFYPDNNAKHHEIQAQKSKIMKYNDNSYDDLVRLKFSHETGPLDGITPGVGWSSDSNHIAPMECFSPLQVIRDGNMATVKASYVTDFNSLIDSLGFSADLKLGYSIFGTNDTFKFINSLSSNKLTLSFAFAEKISRNVNIKYSPIITKLFNQDGFDVYNDPTAKPKFRLFCGDRLVSSYQEGAIVILSMQILMQNVEQKNIIQGNIGVNVHSFAELAVAINQLKERYHLNGSVEIVGYQLGGEADKLSQFLNGSIVRCDLNNIDECKNSIVGAIDYVSKSLPFQFSSASSYTPIGGLNTGWDLDDDLDIKLSPSFVTEDVKNIRKQLTEIKKQQDLNYFHLISAKKGYPVPLSDDTSEVLSEYIDTTTDNINALSESVDCWLMPNRCLKVRSDILSVIQDIPNKNFLKELFGVKLYVPYIANSSFTANYYSSGGIFQSKLYLGSIDTSLPFHPIDGIGDMLMCDGFYGGCNFPNKHITVQGHSTDPGHKGYVNFIYGSDGNNIRWVNDKGETYFWPAQISGFPVPDVTCELI